MKFINQEVEVNAFYFAQGVSFKSFPRQITLDNRQYTFRDGLQLLVKQGQDMIRLFDMTDGTTVYRLRNQNDNWTLIGTSLAR